MVIYSFGSFLLGLEGNYELLAQIPQSWDAYIYGGSAIPSVVLRLQQFPLPRNTEMGDKWINARIKGRTTAIFCHDMHPIFGLGYEFPNREIDVYVERVVDRFVVSGLQFGLILALAHKGIGLHGVTVICENQAFILSAPSGTGKTTLAKLLHRHCSAATVNGDFALLTPSAEYGIVFEPTPFCGTSKVCHNIRLPVNAIVFLEQSLSTELHRLSTRESLMRLLSNTFVPQWDDQLHHAIESVALQLISKVPMYRFSFPPTADAARIFCNEVNK